MEHKEKHEMLFCFAPFKTCCCLEFGQMNVLDGLYPRYVPFPRESFSLLLQKLEKRRREGDRTSLIGSGNVTPFAFKASSPTTRLTAFKLNERNIALFMQISVNISG